MTRACRRTRRVKPCGYCSCSGRLRPAVLPAGWRWVVAGSAWTNQLTNLIILSAAQAGFSGFFVYTPAPGAGNLIGSWAAAAGTDPYGDPYPQGLQVGAASDKAQVLLTRSPTGSAAEVQFPIPSESLSNVPNLAGGVVGAGP